MHMKKLVSLLAICLFALTSFSQTIEVDKTSGLVKVDGAESFYLIKKNKTWLSFDISIQNLAKEELAYLENKDVTTLTPAERGNNYGTYYRFTFSETANTLIYFPNHFNLKSIAKELVTAHLIKENKIDPKAEKAFVVSHNGTIFKDPNSDRVNIVVNNPAPTTANASITLKGNNIYNNSELIGTYKKATDTSGITTLSLYKKDQSKVASAKHNDKDPNEDWTVITSSDNRTIQVLYNPSSPIEMLVKFLSEKGLF